jgi:hypothetical protein
VPEELELFRQVDGAVVLDVDATAIGHAYDDVPLVLVRPDQHVAWRSCTDPPATDAPAILARVTGADN